MATILNVTAQKILDPPLVQMYSETHLQRPPFERPLPFYLYFAQKASQDEFFCTQMIIN